MKDARARLRGSSRAGIAPEPMKDRAVFPELVLAKGICKTAKKPANRCERVLSSTHRTRSQTVNLWTRMSPALSP